MDLQNVNSFCAEGLDTCWERPTALASEYIHPLYTVRAPDSSSDRIYIVLNKERLLEARSLSVGFAADIATLELVFCNLNTSWR